MAKKVAYKSEKQRASKIKADCIKALARTGGVLAELQQQNANPGYPSFPELVKTKVRAAAKALKEIEDEANENEGVGDQWKTEDDPP